MLAAVCCVTGQVTFVARDQSNAGVVAVEPDGRPMWFSGPKEAAGGDGQQPAAAFSPGDRIALRGSEAELSFAPGLISCDIEVVSHGVLPPAPEVRLRDLDWGTKDNARVALAGVLTAVAQSSSKGYMRLSLASADGPFDAEVPAGTADWTSLIDAELRLEGVAMSVCNIRSEFVGVLLRVLSASDVEVVREASDPFAKPLTSLNAILPYSPNGVDLHRRHVKGIVTYASPGRFLWISDGEATLKVNTSDATAEPGDVVEAAGFATRCHGLGRLTGAIVRRMGSASLPDAVRVGWTELDGYPYEDSGHFLNYDGRRVVCTGRLLSLVERGSGVDIVIECEGVKVDVSVDERLRVLSADDISWDPSVSVTGVLELEENPEELQGQLPAIGGWTIRVASAADVSVERDAAWRAHCAAQVGWCVLAGIVVALVIALAAGVVLLLRFRSQKRALALLTDERKRMAADLHDTLEQQLASVRMVLNAAVSFTPNVPEKVAQAVTEANGILAHAKDEMRARIFNMRSDTLFTQGPEKVFTELSRKFARSGVVSVRTHFRGLPDHLAESVFSEVVFILGEAITNAVKHGKCRTIVLTSDPSPNGFTLSVANDGEPFDPAHALGPEAGHFGLAGMRERAKRADIGLSFVHEGRWMILRLAVHA